MRKNSVKTKDREEREGGSAPVTGAEQPMEKTMVKHAVHLQPMEDTTPEQVDIS